MNLANFIKTHNINGLSVYAETSLWHFPIHKIRAAHWHLVYNRLIRENGLHLANGFLGALKDECMSLYLYGEIDDCDLLNFPLQIEPKSWQDISNRLDRLQHNEKCLALFAVSEEMTPQELLFLKWSDISKYNLSDFGLKILDRTIRHFKFNYVFWEYGKYNHPLPLTGFETRFVEIMDMSWDEFVEQMKVINIPDMERISEFTELMVSFTKK